MGNETLNQLLQEFLAENEQPSYDPTTGALYATNVTEGKKRELELPEDVRKRALRECKQRING